MGENIIYNNEAYGEYIKIPSINTFKIPDHIDYKLAALTEPLACTIHGIDESPISEGDTVVINGARPSSLILIILAKLKGAKVISTDLSETRLEYAANMGADHLINASKVKNQIDEVKKFTGDTRGVDGVIDATRFPAVWEMATQMVRKGVIVNLFGGCTSGSSITLNTKFLHYSEILIKGVYHHTPYYVQKAFKLITFGQIDTSKFINNEIPLKNLEEALKLMGSQNGIKYNIYT